MRVAITQCFHEANAFAPIPITLDDFKRRHYLSGEAVRRRFDGDRDWLAGIVSGFDDADAEIAFGVCTACLPGGVVESRRRTMLFNAPTISPPADSFVSKSNDPCPG